MPVVILVADGVRPDTFTAAMDRGDLPALAALRAEGQCTTVTTAFPSVTGVAYAPFLMGRFPGGVGLPGLRWFDRTRAAFTPFGRSRSYIGAEMRLLDGDLAPDAPTMFELVPQSLGAMSVITRGLSKHDRIGRGARFVARAARIHFSGNVRGWLAIDRAVADTVVRRVREEHPRFTFAAFVGVDKVSHSAGYQSPMVVEALRVVDDAAARIRADAERDGRWHDLHLWIVSDHGHSPVTAHDDLAGAVRDLGFRVRAHPWVLAPGGDVAVMVSGNAMAHLYLDLRRTTRPYWPELNGRWSRLAEALLHRESVDILIRAVSHGECAVEGRERGRATLRVEGDRFSYLPETGDPLGVGEIRRATADEAYDRCAAGDYPDSVVQIARLNGAARSGEIIVSAARNWDFRSTYEPIPHLSSHGGLHREHMSVPLLLNRAPARPPKRTVDVMPSALCALGESVPQGLDGENFF